MAVERTSLLVVGAGPYGLAVAAHAIERGIETTVVGHPMELWTTRMPEDMFLRSGLDWHLDASGVDTFEAFAEERGIRAAEVDPIPIAVFLAYAEWFRQRKRVVVRDELVDTLLRRDGGFAARLGGGGEILAEAVVAAPGVGYFSHLPGWAGAVARRGVHTSDLVRFDDLAGARVLIVGGRQSAYEWAALLCDHGAERVDVVHRHPVPAFERVSWAFCDPYMEATVRIPGWWKGLAPSQQESIARRFWEVGRLTLEWWLLPRLSAGKVRRWPHAEVAEATVRAGGEVDVVLSNGERLATDRIVFATGYRPDLARVPYLEPVLPEVAIAEGCPVLDETFQTSLPGLYIPGFPATRDFGPFLGFTRACPVAAALVVDGLLRRP
jgi:thioredoxin reductase